MRPIDAKKVIDELLKEKRHYQLVDDSRQADAIIGGINKALRIVEQAQTISTQKYATRIYDRPGHWYCSECKTMFGRACFIYKHCYNCGAKFDQLLECDCYEDGKCLGTKQIDPVQCEGKRQFCIYNK